MIFFLLTACRLFTDRVTGPSHIGPCKSILLAILHFHVNPYLTATPFTRAGQQKLTKHFVSQNIGKTRWKTKSQKSTKYQKHAQKNKNMKCRESAQHAIHGSGWTHHLACSPGTKSDPWRSLARCNLVTLMLLVARCGECLCTKCYLVASNTPFCSLTWGHFLAWPIITPRTVLCQNH